MKRISNSSLAMNTHAFALSAILLFLPGVVLGHAGEKHEDKGVSVDTASAEENGPPLPIDVGGPFSLTDHNGQSVSNETYLDKHMLVFFGYSNCQVMCSISLDRIGGALELLENENPDVLETLVPLIVTVDPKNDTPAVLKASLMQYHSALIGLTGEPDELDQIYTAYKQSPLRLDIQMNEKDVVTHSSYFYLMGPAGELQTFFPPILDSESMAGILKKYIQLPN